MSNQRTIETVLNLTTGEQIEVDDLFREQHKREAEIFKLRTKIEKDIQNDSVELVCLYCKQPVAIRGRVNSDYEKHFYFTHLYKSKDCIIKTESRLTAEQVRCIKYNGEKESVLHNTLKQLIGHYLSIDPEVEAVKIDRVYKDRTISKTWRKPDVLAFHKKFGKIAFELQLSTTFLSVIVARTIFYQQRGVYLIWIFPSFSLISDFQKFTQKDVFYNNNSNVYVFDEAAQDESRDAGKLVLNCYYKDFQLIEGQIIGSWENAFIEIEDLNFDAEKKQLHYYDSDNTKNQLEVKVEAIHNEYLKTQREAKTAKSVDNIIDQIKSYYKKDYLSQSAEHYLAGQIRYSDSEALNDRLKFTNQNVDFITKLFFERTKPNFLKFLCRTDEILINTSILVKDGKTAFQEILTIQDNLEFKRYLSYLFRKGYRLQNCDINSLDEVFENNQANYTESEKGQIERWALAKLYSGLSYNNWAARILSIEKELFAIASLKYKMLIGYRFGSMKQLAHHVFDLKKEYGVIFLDAIKHYGLYDQLLSEDKTGKLQSRFTQFSQSPPDQRVEDIMLILELFPELRK